MPAIEAVALPIKGSKKAANCSLFTQAKMLYLS